MCQKGEFTHSILYKIILNYKNERNIAMDKYIEVFCRQNPKFSIPCGNSDCKKEHIFKSKDVFEDKIYKFECKFCGETTKIDTTKFVKDFISQLKKLGITVK